MIVIAAAAVLFLRMAMTWRKERDRDSRLLPTSRCVRLGLTSPNGSLKQMYSFLYERPSYMK